MSTDGRLPLGLLIVLWGVRPGAAGAGDFEAASLVPLRLSYQGAPLVTGDDCLPPLPPAETVERRVAGWDTVLEVRGRDQANSYRLELALGRDCAELTFCRLVQPDVHGFVRYAFLMPKDLLDGCNAVMVGKAAKGPKRAAQGAAMEAQLGPEGIDRMEALEYLRLHLAAGALDVDLNPRGVWTGLRTISPRSAEWSLRRTKQGYLFSNAFSRTRQGTIQEFKVIFRRADRRPVAEVHPRSTIRWTDRHRNLLQVNVGRSAPKGFVAWTSERSDGPARWLHPERVRWDRDPSVTDPKDLRAEGVSSADPRRPAVLKINVPRPGHYLVNLAVGAPQRSVAPCEIWSGGQRRAVCPGVAAGQFDGWAVVARADHDRLALELRGDFRLTAFSIAPLLYAEEDFLFRRAWWVGDPAGPEGLKLLAPLKQHNGE